MIKNILLALITSFSVLVHAQTKDKKIPHHPQIVDSRNLENGAKLEKWVIQGYDSKVPYYLIKPTIKTDKYVILLHGITYSKDNWIYPLSDLSEKFIKLKDSLLELGYNLIIPDAKYHGERSYEADFASPVSFFSTNDTLKVQNMISVSVKDIGIIMDFIESKNDSVTFDLIGYSMGGMISILLNSQDHRFNIVVLCVPPLDMQKVSERMGMNTDIASTLEQVSPKNFALLQKAPIRMIVGNSDPWYTLTEAKEFFNQIDHKNKTLKIYDSGHFLPAEFIGDAIEAITSNPDAY